MPSDLTQYSGNAGLTRRQARAVEVTRYSTALQVADARRTAIVASAQMREIDGLATDAGYGQAMLHATFDVLTNGNPALARDLQDFIAIAHMGKADILLGVARDYSRSR